MFHSIDRGVSFCELVEHPCGSDGGEFPCCDSFVVDGNSVIYYYDVPISRNDTFCDGDPEDYNHCNSKAEAIARLEKEREILSSALAVISDVLSVLHDQSSVYSVECASDDDED